MKFHHLIFKPIFQVIKIFLKVYNYRFYIPKFIRITINFIKFIIKDHNFYLLIIFESYLI